ncbi:MAG TPA: hypothetical protein VFK22_07180 [Candidatus Dormibacteraeota bacterium]|nr:hypothetical protein [Candidatus Dormibacteraeota bacterium]
MITPTGQADVRHVFVRQTVIGSLLIVTMTAIGAVAGLAVFREHAELVIRAALAIGGVLVALSVLNSFASYLYGGDADGLRRRRSQGAVRSWPAELLEIEARVSLAKVSAFDHHSRLRPLLREIARQRLEASRHVDIDRDPDQVKELLGAELWRELQPMSLSRDLRESPGPTTAAIERLVDGIESI